MSEEKLSQIRISDIQTFHGNDWEIVIGEGPKPGVSYRARREDASIIFLDENGGRESWQFRNQAIITFRGSILFYIKGTRTK